MFRTHGKLKQYLPPYFSDRDRDRTDLLYGKNEDMAKVTTSRSNKKKPKTRRKRKAPARGNDTPLPTTVTKAGGELDSFSFLIHGVKKIGKTSLALQPDPSRVLVLQFDPPQQAYDRMEVVCATWEDFLSALKKLEAKAKLKNFPYDRVVLDRVDTWYTAALRYACRKLAIQHPTDEAYGKGWDAVKSTFQDGVDRILRLPCGKWFLCHSTYSEEENRHGEKIMKLSPNLGKQPDEVLNGKCDAWFAYTYDREARTMVIAGDERVGAGHRIDRNFRTPDGEAIRTIPMGSSPEEAYENLVSGFENELTSIGGLSKPDSGRRKKKRGTKKKGRRSVRKKK